MDEYWCALALAVMAAECDSADQAFSALARGKQIWTQAGMTELKHTTTWKQVGAAYGVDKHVAFGRAREFRRRDEREL